MASSLNPYITFLGGHCGRAATDPEYDYDYQLCGSGTCMRAYPIERMCPCTRGCCPSSASPNAYRCTPNGDVVQVIPNTLGATNQLKHCMPPADWARYMG